MEPLLQEQPEQPVPQEANEPQGAIDAKQIEAEIRKGMPKGDIEALDNTLKAGMDKIFGKDTHYKMFEGIEQSKDLGGDVGKGMFAIMVSLIQSGNNSVLKDHAAVPVPAGTILLARVYEFMNTEGSGMPPLSEDDYEEANHVFSTMLQYKYDPDYKKKIDDHRGQQGQQQPTEPQAPAVPGQQPLLNQGV